jgi:hypothetical protein
LQPLINYYGALFEVLLRLKKEMVHALSYIVYKLVVTAFPLSIQ